MTAALEGVSGQQHVPAATYTRERTDTQFTVGWVARGGGNSRPHGDKIVDRPVHSQLLFRLSYAAHIYMYI